MGRNKLIAIVGILFIALSNNLSYSQFSLGGGLSSYLGLNLPIKRVGFNAFAEFPRTPQNTFMIRASYMLPVKDARQTQVSAKDFGITPSVVNADEVAKTTFFAIDGGTRYYFINDYDIGFGMYAGGYLKGILASYSSEYRLPAEVDKNNYVTSDNQPLMNLKPQYSVLFSFGGTVGVKYQLPTRGALTFDLGLEVVSRLYDMYAILGNDISPISFSFNLAYRFDWY